MAGGHRPALFARQPGDKRLGPLLAEVLRIHAGGESSTRPEWERGEPVPAGKALYPQSWPHLRHRGATPTQLPHLMGLRAHLPGAGGAGSGLRQRYPLHRRPGPGGLRGDGSGISSQGGGCGLRERRSHAIGRDRYNVRRATSSPTGAWWPSWPEEVRHWCWANTGRRDHTPVRPGGIPWTRTGCYLVLASSTPGPAKWRAALERKWPGRVCRRGAERLAVPWPPVRPGSGVKRGARQPGCTPFCVKKV